MIRGAAAAGAALLALAAGGVAAAQGQGPVDLERAIRQVQQAGCPAAVPALDAIAGVSGLEAQRAAYLLGWCLEREGRHAPAAEAFRWAAAHPTLSWHAQLRQGITLLRSGDAARAAAALRPVAASASGTLRARALLSLGEAEIARRRYPESAAALAAVVDARPADPEAWRLLGAASAAAGRRDQARRAYARAAWAFPGEAGEREAREALGRLLGRPVTARDIDPESRLLRGRRLSQQGDWDQAKAEFTAVTVSAPSGPLAGEAWYRLGDVLMRSDNAAAYRAFHRAATLGWSAAGAWYWAAQTARHAGLGAEARAAGAELLRRAPAGEWAARYRFGAALRAEGAGRAADAALLYRRVIQAAPASDYVPEARWRLGWIALHAGRHADAEARFREAATTAPSRSAAARAWYWAAKTLEASSSQTGRSGASAEAARLTRLVAERYPMTYYGQRARARLGMPPPALPPALPHAPAREAAGPAYEELSRLGLDAEAAEAGEDVPSTQRSPRHSRFLADVYARVGAIPRSVAHAEDALAGGVRDEQVWRVAYPRAYWPEAAAAAQAAGIDPLLLLSLVREESRYDPVIISPAGAVGLAQLLPTTARAMTNDPTVTPRRLTDPAVNLTLGARYVRLQMDRFGGDLRLALAAYNAGPGAARRWINLDADPDYFVEKIGYAETRAYVRRVLGSYGVYRLLW